MCSMNEDDIVVINESLCAVYGYERKKSVMTSLSFPNRFCSTQTMPLIGIYRPQLVQKCHPHLATNLPSGDMGFHWSFYHCTYKRKLD